MKGEKIMIVDDNKEFLGELKEMLTLSGYAPVTINKSTSVLRVARTQRPDIILLDLKMCKMSGFDVAQKLKQLPETASIPIIAMSGYFPIEKNSTLIDMSQMRVCLKKPFAISDLITQIETILSESKIKEKEAVKNGKKENKQNRDFMR